jgi:hypothetical protein
MDGILDLYTILNTIISARLVEQLLSATNFFGEPDLNT